MLDIEFDVIMLTPDDIDWPDGVSEETVVFRDTKTGLVYLG